MGNDPDRKTIDTVHTSSFQRRASLFQRLFVSPSDFDLVRREFLADGNKRKLEERNSLKSFSRNRRNCAVCGRYMPLRVFFAHVRHASVRLRVKNERGC